MRTDSALGEHIRLALEVALLIQYLQRTKQVIAGVLGESKAVATAAEQTIFAGIVIVQGIESLLFRLDFLIGITFGLVFNELSYTFPQRDHAADSVFRRNRYLYRMHPAVFPEVQPPICNGITEIPHGRVCWDGTIFLIQFFYLIFGNLRVKIADSISELLGQVCILIGFAGAVHTEPGGFHNHFAQHHIRMLYEIAVHTDAVFVSIQMHPIRLNVGHAVTFLQKQNVAGDFRSGIALKGSVRQTNGTNQIRPLCKVLTDGGVFLVHCSLGSDKGNNAARSDLIQCLSEKVIVYQPMMLVVFLVQYLKVTERHIADCHVEKAVRHLHLLKAINGNATVLIELLRDPAADGVNFHTVGFAVRHALR